MLQRLLSQNNVMLSKVTVTSTGLQQTLQLLWLELSSLAQEPRYSTGLLARCPARLA